MTFGITPVGPVFPEQTDEGFPQFIQWQLDGENLGDTSADTVNVTGALTATRGVGENENVITLDVSGLQDELTWELDGNPLGLPGSATTINFAGGLAATQVDDVITLQVTGAPPTSFIQWQFDGVDLGDDTVSLVNVVGPYLTATRNSGLGESSIVLTVVPPDPPQWLDDGADRGNPSVIDAGDNLTATQQSANVLRLDVVLPEWQQTTDFGRPKRIVIGNGLVLSVASGEPDTLQVAAARLTFTDVPGDHTIGVADLDNGLSTSGTTGTQNIVVPADAQLGGGDLNGRSVLIYAEGAAAVAVLPVSGVNVHVRSGLIAQAAGQYATLTLIHTRHADDWVLCGDLHT